MTLTKVCTVCRLNLDISNFHNSKRSRDGKGYRCTVCDRLARADYRNNNRKRFQEVARKKQLKFKYDLTVDMYDELLNGQSGCCAICKTANPHGNKSSARFLKNFAIDHCHKTGKIRGLLCNSCNRGLGFFRDSTEILKTAIKYLNGK